MKILRKPALMMAVGTLGVMSALGWQPDAQAQNAGLENQTTFADENQTTTRFVPVSTDRPVGTYKISLSFARPTFTDDLKYYDEVYGHVPWYPSLQVDWMPLQIWGIGLGLKFGGAWYKDTGNPLKASAADPAQLEKDGSSRVHLTLIPLTTAVNLSINPFSGHWIGLDAWAGMEYLYYQEVRGGKSSSSTTPTTSTTTSTSFAAPLGAIANHSWKKNLVFGGGLNILLNWVDPSGPASMRRSLDLGYIYISPFVQLIRPIEESGANFGRREIGVSFRFESIH